jgi:hypothetical protein
MMPWRLKREVYLVLMGCAVLILSGIVLALNQDLSTDLLASIAVLGGLAIIINSLPFSSNGNNQHPAPRPPYDQGG